MKKQALKEDIFRIIFFLSAATAIIAILLICVFIFMNGLPFIGKYGVSNFLLGQDWSPSNKPASFGIFPMIMGSVLITLGAIIIGVPTGIFTSVFMVYYCPKQIYHFLKSAINLMAAIPSIVYGFFGLQLLVPWIRTFSGNGMSVLTASILLGIMILPTIISLSESAIRTVPSSYYSGSLALGASHERTIFKVIVPAAKSGIFSAIILGVGRAIGETMAVILVAGNQPLLPSGLFEGTRTMTTNIVLEMAYASGQHREALIATSAVLFVFILLINACFAYMKGKSVHE
ncbi:phosphate ABC transporter permease subunit PstC [Streptococcus uberis]|uniref:phosphate ABC transporter permease subunit PstC n=1 Tax=Streptococcus uberis TaxID=1349 RepID=UPI0006202C90|nr:phosphate ABC transporter permease subunit PstC [Streptococcus uberis]KKF59636.1 phosphate ABC transporter permease [Streptococcus uberis B362]MCK1196329.1 phosphate ABC transporter permease subunit PstC [Streptococcus uberis]MTB69638.1 phosphate ABC transporter permease subunit PstC [Streptococcus uberis]MTC90275.1 phosphate ABC transporter permease subunit PstC [Streptococcus uberis]MTC96428.1 phosphate ABC transporter permease subunit PstC [Streptococcus uberis]